MGALLSRPLRRALSGLLVASLLTAAGCAVKPQPLTETQRQNLNAADRARIFSDQEAITGPITLAEAMARTIKHNLDHRLKLMEAMLARDQADLARMELLPRLAASASASHRNNASASISRSVDSNSISLESSTSHDRDWAEGDLSITWNLLDFGVSYFRARQEADRLLLTEERRRKVVQNLMREVRFAFWKALIAQRLSGEMDQAEADVESALSRLDAMEAEGLAPPITILNRRRALLEMVKQLAEGREELERAHAELAPLMNLPPGTPFELAGAEPLLGESGLLAELDPGRLEAMAIDGRPELREQHYQARISVEETRVALARLFPGLELVLAGNFDTNSFLLNQSWSQAGLKLTWNLLTLASAPERIRWAEAQEAVGLTRRLALHIAILSQTHIAHRQFLAAKARFQRAAELAMVEDQILGHLDEARAQGAESEMAQLQGRVRSLLARMREGQALAALQNAVGYLQAALGVDPLPERVFSHDLAELTGAISATLAAWGGEPAPALLAESTASPLEAAPGALSPDPVAEHHPVAEHPHRELLERVQRLLASSALRDLPGAVGADAVGADAVGAGAVGAGAVGADAVEADAVEADADQVFSGAADQQAIQEATGFLSGLLVEGLRAGQRGLRSLATGAAPAPPGR